jgi:hypothetical protein
MSMRTISPLRQSMTDGMTARQMGPKMQKDYIGSCKRFTAFLGRSPDTVTADDIRRFQLELAESALSIFNRNSIVSGVKFLFRVTLRRLDLVAEFYPVRKPVTIPPVLSADEVEQLLTASKSLRVRVMLSLAYGCGLRAGEVIRLRAGDIDSAQSIIRIVQSKGRKDRHVMLPPCVFGVVAAVVVGASYEPGCRHGAAGSLAVSRPREEPADHDTATQPAVPRGGQGSGHPQAGDAAYVGYFHLVFTLPAAVANIAWQTKAVVYDLLFKAAAEATLTIAADPRHLGARVGITAVLRR